MLHGETLASSRAKDKPNKLASCRDESVVSQMIEHARKGCVCSWISLAQVMFGGQRKTLPKVWWSHKVGWKMNMRLEFSSKLVMIKSWNYKVTKVRRWHKMCERDKLLEDTSQVRGGAALLVKIMSRVKIWFGNVSVIWNLVRNHTCLHEPKIKGSSFHVTHKLSIQTKWLTRLADWLASNPPSYMRNTRTWIQVCLLLWPMREPSESLFSLTFDHHLLFFYVWYENLSKCPQVGNLCMSISMFSAVKEWRMRYCDLCFWRLMNVISTWS